MPWRPTRNWRDIGNPALRQAGRREAEYTVAQNDNLTTIANQTGTSEEAILAANPELMSLRTGVVIRTPAPTVAPTRTEDTFARQFTGGVGVPSAGPLGVAPGALSTYRESERSTPVAPNQRVGYLGSSGIGVTNPAAVGQGTPWTSRPVPQNVQTANYNTSTWFGNLGANIVNSTRSYAPETQLPTTPYRTTERLPNTWPPPTRTTSRPVTPIANPELRYSRISDPIEALYQNPELKYSNPNLKNYISTLRERIDNENYVPTADEVRYLENLGLIGASSRGGGGYGGGGYSRGRGGSGSTARASTTRTSTGRASSTPAFSTGAGMRGLINWRI